jgi:hypothetical protein
MIRIARARSAQFPNIEFELISPAVESAGHLRSLDCRDLRNGSERRTVIPIGPRRSCER